MKITDFKQRVYEKIEEFRADAQRLPALVYARYARSRDTATALRYATNKFSLEELLSKLATKTRKHRPHQVHRQHRDSLVLVLQLLVQRMDILSMECVFVNPRYNIRRALYVAEIARVTNLSERTVQRCILSLSVSGYISRCRKSRRITLSRLFFKDLKLDLTFDRMFNRLVGLKKKQAHEPGKKNSASRNKQSASDTPQKQATPDNASHALHQSDTSRYRRSAPQKGQAWIDAIKNLLNHRTDHDPPP